MSLGKPYPSSSRVVRRADRTTPLGPFHFLFIYPRTRENCRGTRVVGMPVLKSCVFAKTSVDELKLREKWIQPCLQEVQRLLEEINPTLRISISIQIVWCVKRRLEVPGSRMVPTCVLTGYYGWSSSVQDESLYVVEVDNALPWLLCQGLETEALGRWLC